jgi:hypothetical protein
MSTSLPGLVDRVIGVHQLLRRSCRYHLRWRVSPSPFPAKTKFKQRSRNHFGGEKLVYLSSLRLEFGANHSVGDKMNSPKRSNSERNLPELMLVYLCIKDIAGLNERVSVLDRFGLSNSEIASVCAVAEQSVRNTRQRNKRQAKKNPQKQQRSIK